MPIYVQFSAVGGNVLKSGMGQVYGVRLGPKTLKPRDVGMAIQMISPRDPASGLASGKRQHEPLVITRETDSTSPNLFAGLGNNKVLSKVTLDFLKTNAQGNTQPFLTESRIIW